MEAHLTAKGRRCLLPAALHCDRRIRDRPPCAIEDAQLREDQNSAPCADMGRNILSRLTLLRIATLRSEGTAEHDRRDHLRRLEYSRGALQSGEPRCPLATP